MVNLCVLNIELLYPFQLDDLFLSHMVSLLLNTSVKSTDFCTG